MDKNLSANGEDMGSISGQGKFHTPLAGNEAHVPQLLSLRAATAEAFGLEPMLCNKRSHCPNTRE